MRAVYQGRDPRMRSTIPTFDKAAEIVIEMRAATWRNPLTADIWRSSFRRLVSPVIGSKPISEVTSADVLSVLPPIWNDGRQETARRLRHRIGAVMRWAIGAGHRSDNPAGEAISEALPKNGTALRRHRRALHHRNVAGALARIRASNAWAATKLLLEYTILTATRSGESRLATWSEVDLQARVRTIPAERMKSGREHRGPLSTRVVELLSEAHKLSDGSGPLFPSPTGKALSSVTTKVAVEWGRASTPRCTGSARRSGPGARRTTNRGNWPRLRWRMLWRVSKARTCARTCLSGGAG